MKQSRNFLNQLDQLFQENKIEEAGRWILQNKQTAKDQQDEVFLLTVLNEEIGYARSMGEHIRSCSAYEEAAVVMKRLDLPEDRARATTVLNGATAYRAAGNLKKAAELYQEAERVYAVCGICDTYENASLFNNMSLLFDLMGDSEAAISNLTKARKILEGLEGCEAELATTDTNLGLMHLRCGQKDQAMELLNRAKEQFDQLAGEDAHYWSSLAGLGQAYFMLGNFDQSISMYERAMDSVERIFGHNDVFEALCDNCIYVCQQAGALEKAEEIRKRK